MTRTTDNLQPVAGGRDAELDLKCRHPVTLLLLVLLLVRLPSEDPWRPVLPNLFPDEKGQPRRRVS